MQENGCKNRRGYDINIYLNVVSTYKGKKEVYEISNKVFELLRDIQIDNASIHYSNNNLSVRCLKTGFNDGLINISYKILN